MNTMLLKTIRLFLVDLRIHNSSREEVDHLLETIAWPIFVERSCSLCADETDCDVGGLERGRCLLVADVGKAVQDMQETYRRASLRWRQQKMIPSMERAEERQFGRHQEKLSE